MLPAFGTVMNLVKECKTAAEAKSKTNEITLNSKIKFENVAFSYDKKNESFNIQYLNFTIKTGKITAIVGLSGAGKSTIVDMVMGLLKPDKGSIYVDQKELNHENILSWRNKIGYVAQDTFLFNDTIRNNLLFADPKADDEKIFEVLKLASADEFILKLPEGLDTLIGDRGVLFSGGERQRLALARALLRKPSLLILDEATSNLDSKNEKKIMNSIEKLHGDITILMIAHRLSTISNADIIYLIENGRLIESGAWNELISLENGAFKAIFNAQNTS
jgi:ATP-binding cassette subfamily C protein